MLGVVTASAAYLIVQSANKTPSELKSVELHVSWMELLWLNLADWYVWAVLAIFVFRLARRFPFERGRWRHGLLIQAPASIVFALVASALQLVVNHYLRQALPKPTSSAAFVELFMLVALLENLAIYWVILGIYHVLAYSRKYRERELRASQLEARLAQAQLQVLKMQLHPHFLFNTLHAISALMHQDVELADRMLARLADLLRSTLENADKQEVSLKEELAFIQPYLEIEQARLGPRLTVQLDIDPRAMDALVPNLILQPLVENAVRHGIAPCAEGGRIEISARPDQGLLRLQVRDNGPGLPERQQGSLKEGVGLANTRARLQQLYGAEHRFEIANGQGQGFTATVTIPLREVTGPDSGDQP
jgi:signal transduction histidine kinase